MISPDSHQTEYLLTSDYIDIQTSFAEAARTTTRTHFLLAGTGGGEASLQYELTLEGLGSSALVGVSFSLPSLGARLICKVLDSV